MALDIKDAAYFTHFSIDILKKMQPNLTRLELRVTQLTKMSWDQGRDYLQKLTDDFRYAIEFDPDWIWPHVDVIDGETGQLSKQIPGYSEED
jgi:hypothetical protein